MKAYVINLERSVERLDHIRREMGRIGVAFERIAAVDGTSLAPDDLRAFAEARTASQPGGWSAGQVGCFLSHREAWRRIADDNAAWAAVFEDDIRISPDLARLVASDDWIPADAEIVRLEASRAMRGRPGRRIADVPGRKVHRTLSGAVGSAGYVIARSTAEQLLASPPERHASVDLFLFHPDFSKTAAALRRYQVVPAVCVQERVLSGSDDALGSVITSYSTEKPLHLKRVHPLLSLWPIRKYGVGFRP